MGSGDVSAVGCRCEGAGRRRLELCRSRTSVIGFLSSVSPAPFARMVAAFLQGLTETGYIEGRNVAIEYRWAEGRYDQLPRLAAELVAHRVAVIIAAGGDTPALAAKAATSTIPIVFTGSDFPVKVGLASERNRQLEGVP
jgi:putative tryptophan/tyrosine transport system substrate-binding protein